MIPYFRENIMAVSPQGEHLDYDVSFVERTDLPNIIDVNFVSGKMYDWVLQVCPWMQMKYPNYDCAAIDMPKLLSTYTFYVPVNGGVANAPAYRVPTTNTQLSFMKITTNDPRAAEASKLKDEFMFKGVIIQPTRKKYSSCILHDTVEVKA